MDISHIPLTRIQPHGPNPRQGGWEIALSLVTTKKEGYMDAGEPCHSLTNPSPAQTFARLFALPPSISSLMPWIQTPCSVSAFFMPVFHPNNPLEAKE